MTDEDGVLVDIGKVKISFRGLPINRMTQSLWIDFEPFLEVGPALQMEPMIYLGQIIRTKLDQVILSGGIWQVPPGLWLLKNEVGGWTIMKPEDY